MSSETQGENQSAPAQVIHLSAHISDHHQVSPAQLAEPSIGTRCRVLRHSWEVTGEIEGGGSRLVVLRCDHCFTTRYDRWNTRTGERWGKPSYSYLPGYRDREPGHDLDYWRRVYAEYLYATGVIDEPPSSTTRRRSSARSRR